MQPVRIQVSTGTRRVTRRASLAKQLTRSFDQIITGIQEWLESEDKLSDKAMGYGLLVLTGIFLVGQIVRCLM